MTVHVIDGDGAAASGVPVLVHDEDGNFRSQTETDADGLATTSIPDGGMASVAFDYGGYFGLETFVGVESGDDLWFMRERGPIAVTYEVTFAEGVPGATEYGVSAGCVSDTVTGTSGTLSLLVPIDCVTPAIGAFAYGTAGMGQPIAFAVVTPSSTSGAVPVVIDTWRTDWQDVAFTLNGIAPSSTDVVSAGLGIYVDRRHLALPSWSDAAVPDSSSEAFTMRRPPSLGIAQYERATAFFPGGSVSESRRSSSFSSPVAMDLSNLLPRVTSVSVDWSDPQRPIVDWSTEAAIDADVLEFYADWADGYWWIRAPVELEGPVLAPELPGSFADWVPDTNADLGIEYEELDYLDGYGSLRNRNWIEDLPPESWVYRRSTGLL